MIRKIKIKFVALSMLSLFALLVAIVSGMNILNYSSVIREADGVLSLLSQNSGVFPDYEGNRDDRLPLNMSPELPYESRYFSVLLGNTGEAVHIETSRIISVDADMAYEYANLVLQKHVNQGFVDDFRYVRTSEGDTVRIIFLDCGRKLDIFYTFLEISIFMTVVGFLIVFFVVSFFAGRIIRPIAESYEKQKRFITDAGHEIKTPLAIINANADVLGMDIGKNECLEEIKQQTKRLASLTNDLVYLSRMEEAGNTLQMIEFPVSEVIQETAMSFKTLAQAQKKELVCDVQPMLSMRGNDKAISQLVTCLMDNALKYSPTGATVSLRFVKQNKSLFLAVFNKTESVVTPENLRHVFDRFYRTDLSRNSETGGHGIGLSVAKAIVTAHGGKINAYTQDGHSFQIKVFLPV